jgi:hypothetical protein
VPTILRIGKYRFFFFSNENFEPLHIHVESGENYAKFWLEPINLAKSIGYNVKELNEIRKLIIDHVEILKVGWHEYFNK